MRKLDRFPYAFVFLTLRKCFLIDSQERVREAKSLAVKKTEGNNVRKQERENVSYHQQD